MSEKWTLEKIYKLRGKIKGGYLDGLMSEKNQLSALNEIESLQSTIKELIEEVNLLLDVSLDDCGNCLRDDYSCAKPLIDLVAKIEHPEVTK
jgi:hypothetical protein